MVGLEWYPCCRLKHDCTTLVVLFLVRFVLEFRCGWVGVVSVLQDEARLYHIGRIVLGLNCVGVSVWLGWSDIRVAG